MSLAVSGSVARCELRTETQDSTRCFYYKLLVASTTVHAHHARLKGSLSWSLSLNQAEHFLPKAIVPSKQTCCSSKFQLCQWRHLKNLYEFMKNLRMWQTKARNRKGEWWKPSGQRDWSNSLRHFQGHQCHQSFLTNLPKAILQRQYLSNHVYAASPSFCSGWSPFTKASTFPGCSEVSSFWFNYI